jgi:hypothetical protein
MGPGCGRLGPRLLPEEVVGHLVAPAGVHAIGRPRRERRQGLPGVRADLGGGQVQLDRDLVVGPPVTEGELDNRAALGGQCVQAGHGSRVTCAR